MKRTRIEIDEKLVNEGFKATGLGSINALATVRKGSGSSRRAAMQL
jgi:Arc/MetJ family transcription regulator